MAESTTNKIKSYKESLSKLQQSYDQAKGALDSRMTMLKEKFGFSDIDSAQKQLEKYSKEVDDLKNELDSALTAFENSYKECLLPVPRLR